MRPAVGDAAPPVPPELEPAGPGGAPAGRPESRGRTEIADKVLERIASHALHEVELTGGVSRRVFGVPLGRDSAGTSPQVRARVHGGLATLAMTISVAYPAPVRQVTREVRSHITRRVSELTGLTVRQVDIEVASLTPAAGDRRQLQ